MPKIQIMMIFARLKTIDLDISSFFLGSSCDFSTENYFINKGLRIKIYWNTTISLFYCDTSMFQEYQILKCNFGFVHSNKQDIVI